MGTASRAALLLVLAASASQSQTVTGRYSMTNPQGAPITLTLEADGPGKVKGALAGNGITFTVQGQTEGAAAAGTMRGTTGAAFFEAHRQGQQLQLIVVEAGPDGRPNYATARELKFTLDQSSPVTSAPQVAPKAEAPPAMSTQDQQLSRLFLSSAWCSFSYSGSSTYAGTSGGRTTTTRVVFSPNGSMQQSSNSESTNSGAAGSVYGGNAGGQTMRWRVQDGALLVSSDGAQWQSVQIQVTQNSNGYPIVKADGVEYMQCR